MRLLFINPNTTASMTRSIGAQARAVAAGTTEIVTVNPPRGPAAIETHDDEAAATEAMLGMLQAVDADAFDGIAIACFGDPGLAELRAAVGVPVVGIAESAMLLACAMGPRFAIVAALDSAVPMMEELAAGYGLAARCAGVRATGLSVLQVAADPEASRPVIEATCRAAITVDGADSVCLGCAAMSPLAASLTRTLGRPVLDGVQAAVKVLEAITAVRR
ncbi:MAG TPA: aspartate/glutamate racemase family protein [Actinomycetes bacterium]|nr:aspartate/glutamate racemase family protein [Actinomycetes bacterium]